MFYGQRDARKQRGSNDVRSNDSYDMKEVVMPLHEYIFDPTALDIVHNGATFQVFAYVFTFQTFGSCGFLSFYSSLFRVLF